MTVTKTVEKTLFIYFLHSCISGCALSYWQIICTCYTLIHANASAVLFSCRLVSDDIFAHINAEFECTSILCICREHHNFLKLCLRLLSNHLALALAGGVATSILGRQARPLRNLLFRLMDSSVPDEIQEVREKRERNILERKLSANQTATQKLQ